MNSLQPMAVYSVAGRNGLTVAPEHRCIDAVEAAPQALAMKISLSRLTTTDVSFWPSLFSSVLAGSAYLQLEASLTHPELKPLMPLSRKYADVRSSIGAGGDGYNDRA